MSYALITTVFFFTAELTVGLTDLTKVHRIRFDRHWPLDIDSNAWLKTAIAFSFNLSLVCTCGW